MNKTVPAWTTSIPGSSHVEVAGTESTKIRLLEWKIRSIGHGELPSIQSRFINQNYKNTDSLMQVVNRVSNVAQNKHEEVFKKSPVRETLSYQSDTWARARQMQRHDEDMEKDPEEEYENGVEKIEALEIPPACEDIMHHILEGGYQYSWEDGELQIEGAHSKYGVFSIHFKEGGGLIVARIPVAVTDGVVSMNMCVGTEKSLKSWVRMQGQRRRDKSMLTPGIYRGRTGGDTLSLSEIDDLNKVPAIHPKTQSIQEEIERFFNNIEQFTRLGRPGMRNILLQGPPGTGKTTILHNIARNRSDEMPVVFTTDIETMAKTQGRAAEMEVPVIIMVEDAEEAINVSPTGGRDGEPAGANSEILNFLGGADCPRNENGCIILMTTNRPESIEKRILERPGRVDSIYSVGPIEDDQYVLDCADLYLPDDHVVSDKSILENLRNASGSEIMSICDKAAAVAVSRGTELDDDLLKEMRNWLEDQLNAAEKFSDWESSMKEDDTMKGFDPNE